MSQENLLEIAEAVAGLMPRLARGLTAAEKDPADNLPLAQLRLCGILSSGPRPMSALSRELGVSLSALTQIADRLEKARLVKRVAEENDRRVRCLQLTARGDKMMQRRRDARVLRMLSVLERLSAPQRESVRASLEILVTACSTVQPSQSGNNGQAGTTGQAAAQTATANNHANNHHHGTPATKRSRSKVTL